MVMSGPLLHIQAHRAYYYWCSTSCGAEGGSLGTPDGNPGLRKQGQGRRTPPRMPCALERGGPGVRSRASTRGSCRSGSRKTRRSAHGAMRMAEIPTWQTQKWTTYCTLKTPFGALYSVEAPEWSHSTTQMVPVQIKGCLKMRLIHPAAGLDLAGNGTLPVNHNPNPAGSSHTSNQTVAPLLIFLVRGLRGECPGQFRSPPRGWSTRQPSQATTDAGGGGGRNSAPRRFRGGKIHLQSPQYFFFDVKTWE